MLDRSEVGKRGYLDRDFRLVHLKDSLAQKIDYHYHEFDKLVIFLGQDHSAPGRAGDLRGGGRHLFPQTVGHRADPA